MPFSRGVPTCSTTWGACCWASGGHAQAAEVYRRALALDPSFAEAHLNLGLTYAELGQMAEAAERYAKAARLRPERKLWKLRALSLCPVVFSSLEEMDRYRADLEARLDHCVGWDKLALGERRPITGGGPVFGLQQPGDPAVAVSQGGTSLSEAKGVVSGPATPLVPQGVPPNPPEGGTPTGQDLAAEGFAPPFQLCHHGRNNRALLTKFAAVFAPYFPHQRPPVPEGKPRIGFLVTRKREAGFVRDMGGVVERLDRSRFEVVMLCPQAALSTCRQAIRNARTEWVTFPDRLEPAIARIAAARCHLVYHWQIGTDAMNYLLAFARVAPFLATGWGSHGTTGIPTIDYYLSSRLLEPDAADEHFTETLVRFHTLTSYQERPAAPMPASRGDFGLPATGALYICPERLEKFHPDCDPLFAEVLRRDPEGHLVLLEGDRPHPVSILRQRFRKDLRSSMWHDAPRRELRRGASRPIAA